MSSFLDPRFKGLTHLSHQQRDEVIDSITSEAVEYKIKKTEECAIHVNKTDEPSPTPKRKKSALLVLLGDDFENDQSLETSSGLSTSIDDIVRSEVLRYKSEPSIFHWKENTHWIGGKGMNTPILTWLLWFVSISVSQQRLYRQKAKQT